MDLRTRVLTSSKGAALSGSRAPPRHPRSPLYVRILVVSWQQAQQDKGCKNKSQGTKEEKLLKRQAPAPGQDREAQDAGGTMNVEKAGNGGLPLTWSGPGESWPEGRPSLVASELSPHTLLLARGGPSKSWSP